jgi:hypothetical protein
MRFEATDARLLAHLLADLDAAWRERLPETPELARIYNEDGIGARDPRTGAVVPRLKKVLRGHLDRLLEGWRRRPR